MTSMNHLLSDLRHAPRLGTAVLAAGLLVLSGCSSSGSQSASTGGNGTSMSESAPVAVSANSESSLVIDHDAAYQLGYRIEWQTASAGRSIVMTTAHGDSVYALDDGNLLTRYDADSGDRIWTTPIAKPQIEVLGISPVPALNRVYVTTGGAILEIDASHGGQIGRQEIDKIAATAPVQLGPYLVYGTRNGQVAWHSFSIGYNWRSYEVAPSLRLAPQLYENSIVAIGSDGSISVIDGGTVTRVWGRSFGYIDADPAVGSGAVFVAGRDQHVRGLDIGSGHQIWSYITEDELTVAPVLIGQRLYQYVPSEGLVCFNALPMGKPGGEVIWRSPDAKGSVICQGQNSLFVWNAASRSMSLVDIRGGMVAGSVAMPRVDRIQAESTDRGVIYATSSNGQIIKLVPRNS